MSEPKNASEEMRNKQRIKLDFLATHRIIMTSNNSNYYHEIARFYYEKQRVIHVTGRSEARDRVGRCEQLNRFSLSVLNWNERKKCISAETMIQTDTLTQNSDLAHRNEQNV